MLKKKHFLAFRIQQRPYDIKCFVCEPKIRIHERKSNRSSHAEWAIAKVYDGTWDEIGNAATSLGVAENAVGLPTATWSMENFSVADYEDLFQKVLNGDITIDNNSEMADPSTAGLSNVNVNYIGG